MKKSFTALGIFAAGALTAAVALNVSAAQITEEKARSIALEHAGVKAEDVAFITSKSDLEDGRAVYDIEFLTSDYKEYDYEIAKDNGTILSWDYDAEYAFPAQAQPQINAGQGISGTGTASTALSLEDAKATALSYAGFSATDVIWGKVKQDHDDGRTVYEGTFYNGSMEYEFEIDAASGKITDWEVESIYD